MSVEEADESAIDETFDALSRKGRSVCGEVTEGGVAGYHYYPGRDQVLDWLAAEGLSVVHVRFTQEAGWGYRHFLLRAGRDNQSTGPVRAR